MNPPDLTFSDADFDSLFKDPNTVEGDELILYSQDPSSGDPNSSAILTETRQHQSQEYPPFTMSSDVLSMPPWEPSLTMPQLLNTLQGELPSLDEISPQSAFSNSPVFGAVEEGGGKRSQRPRKKSAADASEGSTSGKGKVRKRRSTFTASGLPDSEEKSRQALLERNRVAASKCRERKKVFNSELEERSRVMGAENAFLKATEAALRHELLDLKYKCLEHSDCDCKEIRDYMKQQVLQQSLPNGGFGRPSSFDLEAALRRASETSSSFVPTEATPTESASNSSNPRSPTENKALKVERGFDNSAISHLA